jgi:protein SCO1/2
MPRLLFWLIPVVTVLALLAALVISSADSSRDSLPVLGEVPGFQFTERNGEPFGLAQMKGRINVVDFIFTNCRSVCPFMAEAMFELYEFYQNSDEVRFVSISVDPARDTLATLREYASDIGVGDDRWVFLHAPLDEVVALMEGGFMLAAENLPMGHPSHFVLVDQQGGIRGYYSFDDEAEQKLLKEHIRLLARGSR